jgi:glycerol-1-phosphate dehydrogenase [NAD(P)+]
LSATRAPLPDPEIEVVLGTDAVPRLVAWSARRAGALVVMDANTADATGSAVAGALRTAGIEVTELVFEQRSGLRAGLPEVERVRSSVREGVVPVAVGSGVITDIVRYAAHLQDSDFVSVPTAASMDGYASSVAALQIDDVKVTFPARAPRAIFADPVVAAAAPAELTRSGIGDLLAKATARVDWLAAHLLYGEPYSEEIAGLVLEPLSFAAANVQAVVTGDVAGVRSLLGGLVQSGIAMAIAGSSRPASGCEHHASHFWDLLAARGMRRHHPHGLQAGYATRVGMRLQRFAFAGGLPPLRLPEPATDPLGPAAREWLGEPTPEIVAAVREKQRFVGSLESWPRTEAEWDEVRVRIAPALEVFDRVDSALGRVGIPFGAGYLDVDERMLRATFRFAGRLRARYTVIDFLEGQGRLGEAIDAVLAGGG